MVGTLRIVLVAVSIVSALMLAGCGQDVVAEEDAGLDATASDAGKETIALDASDPPATDAARGGDTREQDDVTPTVQTVVRPEVLLERLQLAVEGEPEMALQWSDTNGDNVAVLSRNDASFHTGTVELFADHFVVAEGEGPRTMRHVQDGVVECDLDEFARFLFGSFRITDANRDGRGEVTFAYEYRCAGDVGPAEFKVLVLENGEKYIVRGQSWGSLQMRDMVDMAQLHEGEPEPAIEQWPQALWKQTSDLYAEAAIR